MKIAMIINAQRFTDELKEKLNSGELQQKYQIDYDLYTPEPQDIEKTLLDAKRNHYQAYLIGGGDGTVRQAVQSLIDTDTPLIFLPLGTFNMLATDLKLPNKIEEIFQIIKNNKTKLIDIVAVNDQVIINHVWIGVYYYILKAREKHKNFLGKSKLLKTIFNSLFLFKVLPIYQLDIKMPDQHMSYKTCLVFIGNNEFYTNVFDVGKRKTLSSGLVSVTILNVKNRFQLLLSMFDLFFGNIETSKYISYFCTDELSIHAKSTKVNIVIDGELFKLDTPLHIRNYKKSLKVLVP